MSIIANYKQIDVGMGGQKSPCQGCELVDEDKNNPVCVNCSKRIDFCWALDHSIETDTSITSPVIYNLDATDPRGCKPKVEG